MIKKLKYTSLIIMCPLMLPIISCGSPKHKSEDKYDHCYCQCNELILNCRDRYSHCDIYHWETCRDN